MKKAFIRFLLISSLVLFNANLFAGDAEVLSVKGKVEVLRNSKWVGLASGDVIHESETVSTGFQSEAKLKYNGSVMALGALTRITMDELSASEGSENVNVYLNTGAVRAKVTHTKATRVNYTGRSPVAVASVRGTDFLMTASGRVRCFEGAVAVYPNNEGRYTKRYVQRAAAKEAAESSDNTGNASEPGDYGPANANTDAADISSDAPSGAVVVGASQQTEFNASGNPVKPYDVAKDNVDKVKSAVTSAAIKETERVGNSSPSSAVKNTPKTGSVSITIEIDE